MRRFQKIEAGCGGFSYWSGVAPAEVQRLRGALFGQLPLEVLSGQCGKTKLAVNEANGGMGEKNKLMYHAVPMSPQITLACRRE